MAEWKIARRTGACSRCQRLFTDGERHVSLLCVADERLERLDLCAACRTGPGADQPPVESIFWWYTRHRSERRRTVQLEMGALEQLFLSLEGREEAHVRELRYVLCLLLMRKRRLKVERIQRGPAGESFLVKRPRRQERYQVFVFDFTAERMAELRAELQAIFDGADEEGGVRLPDEEAAAGEPPGDAEGAPVPDTDEDSGPALRGSQGLRPGECAQDPEEEAPVAEDSPAATRPR